MIRHMSGILGNRVGTADALKIPFLFFFLLASTIFFWTPLDVLVMRLY